LRAGRARAKDGSTFLPFLPAISKDALKKISGEVRRWQLHRKVNYTFAGLAKAINRVVAGWMYYYGRFYRSAMYGLLGRINAYLVRWIRKKYRRRQGERLARGKLLEITTRYPGMFTHWKWVPSAW
jgi:RNA-directed DNA polymerase